MIKIKIQKRSREVSHYLTDDFRSETITGSQVAATGVCLREEG